MHLNLLTQILVKRIYETLLLRKLQNRKFPGSSSFNIFEYGQVRYINKIKLSSKLKFIFFRFFCLILYQNALFNICYKNIIWFSFLIFSTSNLH